MPHTTQQKNKATSPELEPNTDDCVDLSLTHDDHDFTGKTSDGGSYSMTISLLKDRKSI